MIWVCIWLCKKGKWNSYECLLGKRRDSFSLPTSLFRTCLGDWSPCQPLACLSRGPSGSTANLTPEPCCPWAPANDQVLFFKVGCFGKLYRDCRIGCFLLSFYFPLEQCFSNCVPRNLDFLKRKSLDSMDAQADNRL